MKSAPAAEFDRVFRDSFPQIVRAAWLIVGDWEAARELAQDAPAGQPPLNAEAVRTVLEPGRR